MSRFYTDNIRDERQRAVTLVDEALRGRGFQPSGDRRWRGRLGESETEVDVALPVDFPDALPEVLIVPAPEHATPHIDRRGKVCFVPDQGTLIDAERPAEVVLQALDLAARVLESSVDAAVTEIEPEFEAYWKERPAATIWSICPPDTVTGRVALATLGPNILLAAPNDEAARTWCDATRRTCSAVGDAFFIQATGVFLPERFRAPTTLRELFALLDRHAARDDTTALKTWLAQHGLPAVLIITAPLATGVAALFAVRIPELSADAARAAQRGFQAGHVPRALVAARARSEPVERAAVARFDASYVLPRGGADPALLAKHVALVGCGAVGSHAAAALSASGVGRLSLIDPDILSAENIHRHLLGAADVGRAKSDALRRALLERFPHLDIRAVPTSAEGALDANPDAIVGADCVVIALGHETLERRLNRLLGDRLPRLHVWVEPMGLGGHALLTGSLRASGCFECLFRTDEQSGLTNMASLAAPGQQLQQTLAGCHGTFTPFGAMDAVDAASRVTRLCLRTLLGQQPRPALHSWCSDQTAFIAAGFTLSRRGAALPSGAAVILDDFVRADCPVCSRWGP